MTLFWWIVVSPTPSSGLCNSIILDFSTDDGILLFYNEVYIAKGKNKCIEFPPPFGDDPILKIAEDFCLGFFASNA